jgi:hypothetical protein
VTGALRRCCASAPVASPRVRLLARAKRSGHQRSREENVPEDGLALKAKLKLSCEEIVTIRDLLWMFLENAEEFCR